MVCTDCRRRPGPTPESRQENRRAKQGRQPEEDSQLCNRPVGYGIRALVRGEEEDAKDAERCQQNKSRRDRAPRFAAAPETGNCDERQQGRVLQLLCSRTIYRYTMQMNIPKNTRVSTKD